MGVGLGVGDGAGVGVGVGKGEQSALFGQETVTVNVSVLLVPLAFVAVSVTRVVPATEGVPLIAPVAVLNTKPVGRVLEVKLVGEPVAVMT